MKASHRWALIVLGFCTVLFAGFYWASGDVRGALFGTGILMGAAALGVAIIATVGFAVFVLVIGIHELGHYAVGRLVGFEFEHAEVGPIGIRSENGRAKFFRVRPALAGGKVHMHLGFPPDALRRYFLFVAGGPFFSLALLLALLGTWAVTGLPIGMEAPRGLSLVSQLGLLLLQLTTFYTSVTLGWALVPHMTKIGLPSDGGQLWAIMRSPNSARRTLALTHLNRILHAGGPSRNLPKEIVDAACAVDDGTQTHLYALILRWGWELDHQIEATNVTLERCMAVAAGLGEGLRPEMRIALAHLQATQALFVHRDADAGAAWLEDAEPTLPASKASHATLQAALAGLREEPETLVRVAEARQALNEASRTVRLDWSWEKAWLDEVESTARVRSTESA